MTIHQTTALTLCAALLPLWLTSCTTTAPQNTAHHRASSITSEQAGAQKTTNTANASKTTQSASKATKWGAKSTHTPSVIAFSPRGHLHIGFEDGHVGVISPDLGTRQLKAVTAKPARVVSISPKGDMALVASAPPALVRVKDQKQILRMNHLQSIEDGRFSPNAVGFFVSAPTGKLHIWKRGASLVNLPDEKVQRFVNRQLADVSAQIEQNLSGPIAVNVGPVVAIANKNRDVSFWNPQKPRERLPLFTMPATIRDLHLTQTHVVAVDTKQHVRVANITQQSVRPWSLKTSGVQASAVPTMRQDVAAFAQDGQVTVRRLKDGVALHTITTPRGASCGLAMSHDATRVAVCVDGVIGVIELKQKTTRLIWRDAGALSFKATP